MKIRRVTETQARVEKIRRSRVLLLEKLELLSKLNVSQILHQAKSNCIGLSIQINGNWIIADSFHWRYESKRAKVLPIESSRFTGYPRIASS